MPNVSTDLHQDGAEVHACDDSIRTDSHTAAGLRHREGGSAPRWRRDGRELFYLDLKGRLIGVSVTTTPDFSIQKPTLQVQTPLPVPLAVGGVLFPYDVAPDGDRFLLTVPITGVAATPISVRVNWAFLAGSRQ